MKRAVTSSSNLALRRECPGSARLEAPFPETESEYSAEGTMLHKLFMTGLRPDTLTPEQVETLDLADFYAEEFFRVVRGMNGISDDPNICMDEREVGMSFKSGAVEFPGHADLIRNWPGESVRAIVDVKFGYMDVPTAADNLQLASYGAMRWLQAPIHETAVCIIQPRNFGPRQSMAVYGDDAMLAAQEEIERIVLATLPKDAPTYAGDWCHFCKAKAICGTYTDFAAITSVPQPLAVETLDNESIVRLLEIIARAKSLEKEVSTEVKYRIRAGSLPGLKLQGTGDVVTLIDAAGFLDALQAKYGPSVLTAEDFDACRKIVWSELDKLIAKIEPKLSKKKLDEMIDAIAAPYVTRTPKEPRIVREKTKEIE